MHNKTIAAGALLLLAMIAPAAIGHSERAAIPGDASLYPLGSLPNTVSGRYVGAAGPAVALEAYSNPEGTLAVFATLCDAEVVVDSNTVGQGGEANEPNVDGSPTVGQQPINFWDDGGIGVACHVNHYTTPQFNTPGCQGGLQAAGGTHAGTDIWVGASCDWKTDEGGDFGGLVFLACLISSGLATSPNPGILVSEVLNLAQCVVDYVACLLDPTGCAVGGTQTCGADTFVDATNYGYAGVGAAITPAVFPAATGIYDPPGSGTSFHVRSPVLPSLSRYASSPGHEKPPELPKIPATLPPPPDPPGSPCAQGDEAALIAVFDTVATNGGGVNSVGSVDVYPALAGEVWTIAPRPATFPAHQQCVKATATNPVVVQTVCQDSPGGPICWPWISIWDPVNLVSIDQCLP